MAYTVKQVAQMSGVSVRMLRFYDQIGVLSPAYQGSNGYRYYDEPQLLTLQQILFYRELGFDLKQTRQIIDAPDFEKSAALLSHRHVLQQDVARTCALLDTIDKTVRHLKGEAAMTAPEMFSGFKVASGRDRFDASTQIEGYAYDCKISGRDTGGAMCVFEMISTGWTRHLHYDQDEWIYIIDGSFRFEVGDKQFVAHAGETVFLPRKVTHAWEPIDPKPGRVLNTFQPAGRIEDFVRQLATFPPGTAHEVLGIEGLRRLFREHAMELTGPPLTGTWQVDDDGRITRTA